jgi:hypothetical protein
VFAVYERDAWSGVDVFASYGVAALPLTPGMHELECHTWRANDRNVRLKEAVAEFFAGARAELAGWKDALLSREDLYASSAMTVGGAVCKLHAVDELLLESAWFQPFFPSRENLVPSLCFHVQLVPLRVGMGSVHLQLQVLTRGLDISGIHVGGMTQAAAAERARLLRDRRQHRAGQHTAAVDDRDESPSASRDGGGYGGGRNQRLSGSGGLSGSGSGAEGDRFGGGGSGDGGGGGGGGLASVRRHIRDPEGTGTPAAGGDRYGLGASLGAGAGGRVGRFSRDGAGGAGAGGVGGDLPPRRSRQSAAAAGGGELPPMRGGGIGGGGDGWRGRASIGVRDPSPTSSSTAAAVGGGRGTSTLLSERRTSAAGGAPGGGGYAAAGGAGVGAAGTAAVPPRRSTYAHQRESIEDAPLAPDAGMSRREARLSRMAAETGTRAGAGAGAGVPRSSRRGGY